MFPAGQLIWPLPSEGSLVRWAMGVGPPEESQRTNRGPPPLADAK